ncbi:hypothetical protein FS800_26470 [Agrobacterium vitis]|uniref:hypothetical protein n=1 Tax=Rhizobium/Agrobacterium group TaxID=227290 RepID=UPI0015745112|nr:MULTISPECIES: hypothetical protein [Rhizobium/Agrobacterium group]MCF1485637.1 hypothetical protein [Allorhizobium ampelinum]NSZ19552.1 hypothetical protein [Agrobacterium vitis]QZO07300.1 hypothetical protein K4831_24085 [Agrobacterium vitis]UJL91062.1 hypothetical protein AVF2S5_24000 [Agrobacterium vitis]BCH62329.1 hypothetical protein RvVAR0630_pl04710 [Agrobacterium vitis]
MALVLRDLPAFIADENAHIPMRDRHVNWLVIVTREALGQSGWSANAPDRELSPLLPMFQVIATYKLEHWLTGEEATIWLLEQDIIDGRSRPRN